MKKRILINEQNFRLLFESNEINQQLQGLRAYLESGQKENIELAFEIADSLGIYMKDMLKPYDELFIFLNQHDELKNDWNFNQKAFKEITNLEFLLLNGLNFNKLPNNIGMLKNLEILNCARTPLKSLPESIGNLISLTTLNLSDTEISSLPITVGNLTQLEYLNLTRTNIQEIPKMVGNLLKLKELHLRDTSVSAIPAFVENLTSLEELNLYETQISEQEKQKIRQILPNCTVH